MFSRGFEEHVDGARCGLEVYRQLILSSRSSNWIDCWCAEQSPFVATSQWATERPLRQWTGPQCMPSPDQRMACGPADRTCSRFSGRSAANAALSELMTCDQKSRTRHAAACSSLWSGSNVEAGRPATCICKHACEKRARCRYIKWSLICWQS